MEKVITIERQYASGGLQIGQIVARKLGIPCYNREILVEAAEKSQISPEYLESVEENVSRSLLFRLSLAARPVNTVDSAIAMSDKLYFEESKIIRRMAESGSCVIIGRCGNYILRDMENCLNVFICASDEDRMKRAVEEYGVEAKVADYIIKKNDKRRAAFYDENTSWKWGMKENYHMCLNSSILGIESCADMIIDGLKYVK